MDAATIEHEALGLTSAERALLADRLLQTLDIEDVTRRERWGDEAERRLQSLERGEIAEIAGHVAVAAIRQQLK